MFEKSTCFYSGSLKPFCVRHSNVNKLRKRQLYKPYAHPQSPEGEVLRADPFRELKGERRRNNVN